jgi:hypothetical protein
VNRLVLTGSADNTARLWDAATGEAVATLTGHTAAVRAVAFSTDGKRVLTGSDDNTARLWDAATGEAVATLKGHTAPVWDVAFSPDGKRVLTGSADNTARLWDLFQTAQELVQKVKATMPRCLTPAQREGFYLGTAIPRWCYARNLWPYADHGPSSTQRSDPPFGPAPAAWDEWLIATWDRVTGWLARPPRRTRRRHPVPPRARRRSPAHGTLILHIDQPGTAG